MISKQVQGKKLLKSLCMQLISRTFAHWWSSGDVSKENITNLKEFLRYFSHKSM